MSEDESPGPETGARSGNVNDLSGQVLGPSIQAGTIHGNVYIQGAPNPPAAIPRQLLPVPAHFAKRAQELAELDRLLEDCGTLAVLTGPGGVGKTALAMRWAHTVAERFPGGQLHVDLRGFRDGDVPMHPGDALGMFLRALGVPAERVPATVAEQAALYRSITAGRSLLVVLDDAYSTAQARVLIPASPASMTVITSRSSLAGLVPDGARLIEVRPLTTDDSIALLSRAIGSARIEREPARAADLARICGGLPIALCVAAARLVVRPRLSLEQLTADLADETRRLDALSQPDGRSVQAAFDMSYRSLEPAVAELYRRLALHPGPAFGLGPIAALVSDIEGAGAVRTQLRMVDRLLDASLLQETDLDRFALHDLARLHGRRKAEEEDGRRGVETTVRVLGEWYFAAADLAGLSIMPYRRRIQYRTRMKPVELPSFDSRTEALDWFELERANLIAAGRAALEFDYAELAWHLCDVMSPLFIIRKHYRDRMEVSQRGVVAARKWGNVWAEGEVLKRLGRMCTVTHDYPEAERHLRRAIACYQDIGDTRGELDVRETVASLYLESGREEEATAVLEKTLAGNRALGDDRCTGRVLLTLGTLLARRGRPRAATELLHEAQNLFARLSDVDPYNGARVLVGLATAYLAAGQLDSAERAASDGAARLRELGAEFERAEAMNLLGRISEQRQDVAGARRHYRLAIDAFTAIGSTRAAAVRTRLAALDGGSGGTIPAVDPDRTKRPSTHCDPRS